MPFDQTTRNRLSRFVADARARLTTEFTRQLQRIYGIDPATGEVTDIDRLTGISDAERQTSELLRETAEHYRPGFAQLAPRNRRDTIDRVVREQAFTVLNRFCALRMAEARGLLIESVAAGYQSRGFQLYTRLAGSSLGETGVAYRYYLFSVFDELAVDLPALFDRFSPQGRLFPGEATLLELLDLINHVEIEPLWTEDETIGWIYQYFNSKEERKAMRDASAAPRNSRELAVRNQFFTPRYVVEFLTDNTLGRIWYEMTKGATGLVDSCRYLVRRPTEIFLAPGEQAPPQADSTEHLSQEELLQQPVYIPHRPLKDPRAITMLDPACGSMHFGLYAFDLFEQIYAEAWDLEETHGPHALERAPLDAPLHEIYTDREQLLRDAPRLIVERNIHGVDIDPRAVQIAGLSLWLRAQKSWREQGLKSQERPQIRRSNIVCAEPMPGDTDLLAEFIARHLSGNPEDKVVAWMLRKVFNAMTLAGEAGMLLKIEEEIDAIVATARADYERAMLQQRKEAGYLPGFAPERETTLFDLLDLPRPEEFWTRAEERIDAALRDYAAFAEGDGAYRRRLFAGDAARGFAFIDLCRKRYDVVLMNPPFGNISSNAKEYIDTVYAQSKHDVACSFVERWSDPRLSCGLLGAITTRTPFFLEYLSKWRENIILDRCQLNLFADFGDGVLEAMVETCAYTLSRERCEELSSFFRLSYAHDKVFGLLDLLSTSQDERHFLVNAKSFRDIPGSPFCYWKSESVRRLFSSGLSIEEDGCRLGHGAATTDNERFLRLSFEVPEGNIGRKKMGWHIKRWGILTVLHQL
jgi:hypothetical protein